MGGEVFNTQKGVLEKANFHFVKCLCISENIASQGGVTIVSGAALKTFIF